MKLTSAQWQVLFPYPHVLDPDGWDRKNFDHSWWEEQLTYEEYQSRLVRSTTAFHGYPEPLLKRLKTQIGQLLGEATMAWKPRPTGVFKTEEANKVLDKIMQMVEAGITFERNWNNWVRDETAKREKPIERKA